MGQGLSFILLIAAALAVTALIGHRDRKAAEEKAVTALKEGFGKAGSKSYPDGRKSKIDRYFLKHPARFCLDDITWNDLDMDAVYERIDRTCSAAGEEYLYRMLRCPSTDGTGIPHKEKIEWWTDHEEERIRAQRALQDLGSMGKYSIYDYLDALDDLEDRPLYKDLYALILPAAALVVMAFYPGPGLILFLLALVFNIVQYFRVKAKIDPYLQSFRYILRLNRCAKDLGGIDMPLCKEEKERLREGSDAMASFSRGSGILMRSGSGTASANPFGLIWDYLCILFHFDLMKYGSMLRQVRGCGDQIDAMITAIGSIDTQISISSFRVSLPHHCAPDLRKGAFDGHGMYHPLLEDPVPSDIHADRPVLITGSNASGKSTFLKTTALCALLAQTIGVVPAAQYSAPAYRIYTSMALRDDLRGGESYFLVEIRSLKRVLDAAQAEEESPVLCCVDEVLRGTNTLERISASTEILKVLAQEHVQVFAATHDLELTDLLADSYDNYHFSEEMEGEDVRFSYQLLPGSADSRNAIKLLRRLGYDASIADRAQERADHFLETGEWQ